MALAGSAGGHVHVYLVSISIDPTIHPIETNMANRIEQIREKLTNDQREFDHIYKFKVCGEPLILAIYQVPVEKIKRFELSMTNFHPYRGVTYDCAVLTSYETFANETLGVPETLTRRESDNYIARVSPLLWCQYTLNFKGKRVEVMREAWKEEATMFMEARKYKGVKSELYKVVGQPKVHAFVSMTPQEWDKFAFKQPTNEADAGALTGLVKVVRDLDQ